MGRPRLFLTPPRAPRKGGGGGKTRPKQTFREGAKRRREGGKGRKGGDVKAFFFCRKLLFSLCFHFKRAKVAKVDLPAVCAMLSFCEVDRPRAPFVWFLSPLYPRLSLAPLHKQKEASIRVEEEEEEEEEQDEEKREEARPLSPYTSWLQRRVYVACFCPIGALSISCVLACSVVVCCRERISPRGRANSTRATATRERG